MNEWPKSKHFLRSGGMQSSEPKTSPEDVQRIANMMDQQPQQSPIDQMKDNCSRLIQDMSTINIDNQNVNVNKYDPNTIINKMMNNGYKILEKTSNGWKEHGI